MSSASIFVGEWLQRQGHFWPWPLYILFKSDGRHRMHCLVFTDTDLYSLTKWKSYLAKQKWRWSTCLQDQCYDVGCHPCIIALMKCEDHHTIKLITVLPYNCLYLNKGNNSSVKGSILTKLIGYQESMVLIICTKNELNLTNRYWDMVPYGRTDVMDGRTDGRRQNYIPPTLSGDNKRRCKKWLPRGDRIILQAEKLNRSQQTADRLG